MVDDEHCTLGLIGKVLGSQRHAKHEIVRLRIFETHSMNSVARTPLLYVGFGLGLRFPENWKSMNTLHLSSSK